MIRAFMASSGLISLFVLVLMLIAGDDEHKAQLNERSDNFDAAEAWNTRGISLAVKALASLAKEKARDKAKLYNPFQGQDCARRLEESLEEFLERLPPSTSVISDELPWIYCANPYVPRRDCKDCETNAIYGPREGFLNLCEALLEDLEEQMAKLKIDMEGKPAGMLTMAVNQKRSEVVEKIHQHAIDLGVKTGKVRDYCLESEPLLSSPTDHTGP
jgi:hypothetical protein